MNKKDKSARLRRALLSALFPGGGYLYLGLWGRALIAFSILFVVVGFAVYALVKYYTSTYPMLSYALFKQGQLALVIGIPLWVVSALDAARLSLGPRPPGSSLNFSVTWQEFRIALPDLVIAAMFIIALADYARPVFQGYSIWPPYAFWGFFEMLSLPIAPGLMKTFSDKRRGTGSKVLEVAVLTVCLGWFTYQMNPAFGINFILFILMKAVGFSMGRIEKGEELHVQMRAALCFAALFCSGVCLILLKILLSWTAFPLRSQAGDLDMLVMGLIYFLLLGVFEVLWMRRRLAARPAGIAAG